MSLIYVYAFLCVLVAGIVRGFSGFAFAFIAVISLSFALPPATIVPAVFLLEVAAGLHLLPSIWKSVHWQSIRVMSLFAILCTPLGVYVLTNVPEEPMKIALAIFGVVAAAVLLTGYQLKRMPTTAETAATGAAAGLLNGAFGIGGPPIIIFFLGSPLALEAGRASIVAAFLAMDIAALAALFLFDLYTRESLTLTLLALPALVIGVYIGSRMVGRLEERTARKAVLVILLLMSVATGLKSLLQPG
jgi:uncharacterized membrane protein YfcA